MKRIVYSILQYRHSMLRNEAYGIGIVFYFPDEEDKMIFYNTSRFEDLKHIYRDIDCRMLATYLAFIDANVRRGKIKHYPGMPVDMELKLFLKQNVLLEDSTVLRFTDPVIISNVDSADLVNVLKNYVKMLLSFQDGGEHNMIRNLLLQ